MFKDSFFRRWLIPIFSALYTVGLLLATIFASKLNILFGPTLVATIFSAGFCALLFISSATEPSDFFIFIFYIIQFVAGVVLAFFINYFTYVSISFLFIDLLLIFYFGLSTVFPRRFFSFSIVKFVLDLALAFGISVFGVLASNAQLIIYISEVLLVVILIACFPYKFITMLLFILGLVVNTVFMVPTLSLNGGMVLTNLSMIGFIFYAIYFGILLFAIIYDLVTKSGNKVAKTFIFLGKLVFSLIPLIGSFFILEFKFDQTKFEDGLKMEIRNGEAFVSDAEDREFIEITNKKFNNVELRYEDGCFRNLRSLKRLRIEGTPFSSYVYKLFGTEPFEDSYCVNGYYIPNSLKIVELVNTANTVNTLSLLNSVDTLCISSKGNTTLFDNPFTSTNLKTIVFNGKTLSIMKNNYTYYKNLNIFTNGTVDFGSYAHLNMHVYNYDFDNVEVGDNYVVGGKKLFKAFGDDFDASSLNIDTLVKDCFDGVSITIPNTITNVETNWGKNVVSTYVSTPNNKKFLLNKRNEGNTLDPNTKIIGPSLYRFSEVSEIKGSDNKVEYISEYAFAEDNYLFKLPDFSHLIGIQKHAFSNCHGLDEFTFADSLKFIGENAFEGTGLKEVYLPKGITTIEKNAFINSKVKKIYLEADEIPETFEEGFDNANESGGKIEVILGAAKWERIFIQFLNMPQS